jgi:hypothetical protein
LRAARRKKEVKAAESWVVGTTTADVIGLALIVFDDSPYFPLDTPMSLNFTSESWQYAQLSV